MVHLQNIKYTDIRSPQSEEKLLPDLSMIHVLLIEDVDDMEAIVRLGLELIEGFKVVSVKPEGDWLTFAQDHHPDIIILDTSSSEWHILQKLQNQPLTSAIPVLGLVSRDRAHDQRHARSLGAAAILAKPFDVMVLAEMIKEILTQSTHRG